MTGAVWYGTDDAYRYEDSAAAACAALGYRVATSAEVEALGGPLPKAFHAVYAWTNTGFFPPSPRPIVTSDGCVDVLTASQYAGDCAIPGVPHISRSTMCIR